MTSSSEAWVSFTVESLEKRLASNSASPFFALLASLYLDTNRLEEARDLCERGKAHYPEYATARLVLGRCYLRLRKFSDARRELEQTLALQPRCEVASTLLREAETGEKVLLVNEKTDPLKKEPAVQIAEDESREDIGCSDPVVETGEEIASENLDGEIATPTLAEIYASQRAYREAIRTYSLLLHRKPEERERFEQRIRELEEKRRSLELPT